MTSLRCSLALALGALSIPRATPSTRAASPPHLVRQIDHVLLASNNASELFTLCTETFQLPVAWPFADYGGFGSGGVALGNVNLEIIEARESSAGAPMCRFVGLALEPAPLESALRELDARDIAHGQPAPFRSPEFTQLFKKLWTTVALPEVSHDALEVFFCEYTHAVAARRQRLRAELQSRGGGPLGVVSVREIAISARNATDIRQRWQKLLFPIPASPTGVWQLAGGPAIRVVPADEDAIQEIVIVVISLADARRFLQRHDLLGVDHADSLTIASPRFPGFQLTLVER